jgi:hypothetical protein
MRARTTLSLVNAPGTTLFVHEFARSSNELRENALGLLANLSWLLAAGHTLVPGPC